jgi:hypothetical protein
MMMLPHSGTALPTKTVVILLETQRTLVHPSLPYLQESWNILFSEFFGGEEILTSIRRVDLCVA